MDMMYRWWQLSRIYGLHSWDLPWFSWSSTSGPENSQMPKSVSTVLLHLRYAFPSTMVASKDKCTCTRNKKEAVTVWNLLAGVLSSLDIPGSGFTTGQSFEARHPRDGCRPSVLLFNRASSSSWRKKFTEDSCLGVSFSCVFYQLRWSFIHASNW